MSGITYANSVDRPISDILGERLSVLSFGAVGDGVTDDAPAINKAIASLVAVNGKDLYLPGGRTYLVQSPIVFPSGVVSLRLSGDGDSTVVKRGTDMPTGKGVFDIQGSYGVHFRSFRVEGDVVTPVGYTYGSTGDFNNDPMHDNLTKNTTFWVHSGSKRIRFEDVRVSHTGGYSILLDATSGDIDDVRVFDCLFENNRPHLFGSAFGDLTYGSWTGGLHYQGDGAQYAVNNLVVAQSTFRRNTGNCVWGHLYALTRLHSNVRIYGNHFEDCGLDAVLMGGVIGGAVEHNTFRRIGYICTDDTSPSVPKYLSGRYAVGLDTAGLVRGVNYKGNTFVSCNGGCMDLDGYSQGTVSANTCIIPAVGEQEYTVDNIATFGPGGTGANWVYGVQVSNSNNDATAGTSVTVIGNTFINMGGGAVKMYASRGGTVSGNKITHPANANVAPIVLGNIGTGDNQRARNTVVCDNVIEYNPSAPVGCVQEDAQYGAFQSGDKNWVFGNKIQGSNVFEFYKDSNSGSISRVVFSSTKSELSSGSENIVQREDGYLRWYKNLAGTATSIMTLLDAALISGTPGGPLLNVSGGAGVGGVVSTGGRLTSAFDDTVLTGKVYGDAFIALGNATYADADANLLGDNYGLIRYDATAKKFQQSTSVSGGSRVWVDFGGGSTAAAGSDGELQFNNAGLFGASSNLSWSNSSRVLTIAGLTSTAGLVVSTGYTHSAEGFYTPSTAATSIQSPSGGIAGKWLIGTTSLTLTADTSGSAGLSATGQGRIYFDSAQNKFLVSENGASYVPLIGNTSTSTAAGSEGQIQYNHSSAFGASSLLAWNATNGILYANANPASPPTTDSAAKIQTTGYVYASVGFSTPSTATTAIQAASGGVYAKYLIGQTSLTMSGDTQANAGLSSAGQGRIYFDSATARFKVSENGGAFVNLTSPTSPAGSNQQIQFNNSGVFGANSGLLWNGTSLVSPSVYINSSNAQALQIFDSGSNVYGGVIAGSIGINGASTASQMRVSARTADVGMYFTVYGDSAAIVSAGASYNGIAWVAKDTVFSGFNLNQGGVAWHGMTGATVGGSYGFNELGQIMPVTGLTVYNLPINISNGQWINANDTTGTARNMLTRYTDNNVYLDNNFGSYDIYIRPGTGRYVFLGSTNVHVLPTASGDLGASGAVGGSSGRWANAYFTNIDVSGTATGLTRSVNGLFGDVTIAQGSNITITKSGQSIIIAASGSAGGVSTLNGFNGAVSISGSSTVSVSSASNTIALSVPTSAALSVYSLVTSDAIQSNRSVGPAIYAPFAYIQGKGLASSGLTAYNSIQSTSGISAGQDGSGGFYIGSTQVVNIFGQHVGNGALFQGNGVGCGAINIWNGFNAYYSGRTVTLYDRDGNQMIFRGGALCTS